MPPRRCFPRGSSEAAFHGIFQRRRCAQRRRSLLSFSPRRPGNGCRAPVPAHANRRAVPSLFHIFLPPGRTSFFTQPSCQRCRAPLFLHPFVPPGGRDSAAFFAACTGGGAARSLFALSAARPALHLFFCTPPPATGCRARSPHPSRPPRQPLFPFPCFRATGAPMRTGGQSLPFSTFSYRPAVLLSLPSRPANDAARTRRGDASRWARPRRLFAGFCRAAETMLADGLV